MRISVKSYSNIILLETPMRYSHFSTDIKSYACIPKFSGLPLIGSVFSLMKQGGPSNLHEYVTKKHIQLGSIYEERFGNVSSLFLNDPNEYRKVFANEGVYPMHVLPESWKMYNKLYNYKRGLYFMDGEEWLKYRRIMNNVLLRKDYTTIAIELCNDMLESTYKKWINTSTDGKIVDLNTKLYELSISFMITFLCGTPFKNTEHFVDDITTFATVVQDIFKWSVQLSVVPVNMAVIFKLPVWNRFVNSVSVSIEIANRMLSKMISEKGDGILNELHKQGIKEDDIIKIAVDMIIAAGDTTAVALQWILYLLGRNYGVQNQLYNLIKENDQNKDLLIRNIVKESMRLYPVAPFIARYLPNETVIAGYKIPANKMISMSMYTSSRDERYFPNSDKFDPYRWIRSVECGVKDNYASLPYAAGARSCIGKRLSQAQLNVCILKLVENYQIEVKNEVNAKLHLITIPDRPIDLYLHRRTN